MSSLLQQDLPAMWNGLLANIFIAPEAAAPMQTVAAVRAVPERGLQGDRYYKGTGAFSRWPGPRRQLTLIAEEALEEMAREAGVVLDPAESRRNLLTRGVPLNDLIKKEFYVGEVRLRGIGLCQPCKYLVRHTGQPGLIPGLVGRGGLRAQILCEGIIQIGDAIHPIANAS